MSVENSFIEKARNKINTYYEAILEDPELKTQVFDKDYFEIVYGSEDISNIYFTLNKKVNDVFYEYSVVKYIFYFVISNEILTGIRSHITQWYGAFISVGAYTDCIYCAKELITSSLWPELTPQEKMTVLQFKAKSERNIGLFEDSFNSYRMALKIANDCNNMMEKGIILLKIGKVYSNYLSQKSLALGFLQEAYNILTEMVDLSDDAKKYISICHDALGQVKRDSFPLEAESHFNEAIRINNEIGRLEGNSRVKAHLITLEFNAGNGRARKLELIDKMQDIIQELLDDEINVVGTGVRWVQLSAMYISIEEYEKAAECLEVAKDVALKYSDNKTLVRSLLLEGKMFRQYPQKAYDSINAGKMLASKYKLMLYESQINNIEIEFYNYLSDKKIPNIKTDTPVNLLEKNKIIYMDLINKVKDSLHRVNSREGMKDEFSNLSYVGANTLKENILLDYDEIITRLDIIIKNLMLELYRIETKKQELLVLSVMNSIARELLHDLKGLIPLKSEYSRLNGVCDYLRLINDRLKNNEVSATDDNIRLLDLQIKELENIDVSLSKIKDLVARNIRIPRDLTEEVSLSEVCSRVINEVRQIMPRYSNKVTLRKNCSDIYVKLNTELIFNTVSTLVRNAIDFVERVLGSENTGFHIYITLDYEFIGNQEVGNMSQNGIITILTAFEDKSHACMAYELINKGLYEGHTSDSYSSGFGLEFVKRVFGQLIKGVVEKYWATENNRYMVGIRIVLPIGINQNIEH